MPARKLAKDFNVTERTIRNDVNAINTTITRYGACIDVKRGTGYFIAINDADSFDSFLELLNSRPSETTDLGTFRQRLNALINLLIDRQDFISREELSDCLCVSENTLKGYIKQATDDLRPYGLDLISQRSQGLKIYGTEADKRRYLISEITAQEHKDFITDFTAKEQRLFGGVDLAVLQQTVAQRFDELKISATDYGFKIFLIHLATAIVRAGKGNHIERINPVGTTENAEEATRLICSDIALLFGVKLDDFERSYVCLHLLANTNVGSTEVDNEQLRADITRLLERIYEDYGFDLRRDIQLRQGLFEHLKSIYRDSEVDKVRHNPLINTIQTNFPLAYEITLTTAAKVFRHPSQRLTEDEIGYMSLHIGAAIERSPSENEKAATALLVCGEGRSVATMLEARIATTFKRRISITKTCSYQQYRTLDNDVFDDIDIVISTMPLIDCKRPNVLVDCSLSAQDIKNLQSLVEAAAQRSLGKIRKFFGPNAFSIIDEPVDKRSLLARMCSQLDESRETEAELLESVLHRETLTSTAMCDLVALPHPMKPLAHESRVPVAILRNPIAWSAESPAVQIVLLFSIRERDTADIEQLYDLLIKIINDKQLQRKIIGAQSFDEFITILACA